MNRGRSLLVASLLVARSCVSPSSDANDDGQVLRWVEQVILGTEYGGDGRICSRWVKQPTLSVFGGTKSQIAVVHGAVRQINQTLASTPITGIEIIDPDDEKGAIRVYIAPSRDFPEIAKRYKFEYVADNIGYLWAFWNGKHEIQRAIVLLSSDPDHKPFLPHIALEEVTQTLGLAGDSPELRDSIFYSSGDEHGDVEELSSLDKALIVFFYNHVEPGAREADVRRAFNEHWRP